MTKQLCGEDAEPCCRLGRCAHLSLLISHPTAATYALGHAVKTECAGRRTKMRHNFYMHSDPKSRDDNDNERHICRQNGRSRSEEMLDITRHRHFLVLLSRTSAPR